ncbi:alkene reductase [Lichenicoccus roseus]|uniref:Alkene reductase n=1 Tax=Lichenicoccus roseus TaxID=2683649 RepID=A0A5R9J7L7_9PROT|nr:alkene reductase [Lichenicoccus roseus]TLU72969.1 alkene reductase [Lichenicoccus roseus]
MPSLFDPIRLGAIELPNRILMAPLTRGRASERHVPTPRMAEYYAQRASAGLIISEATGISQEGLGWPFAPGIWSGEQVEAWRPVVRAVHEAGGRIVCQLWHMGRLVHPDFLGGAQPVSSAATTAPGAAHTYKGKQPYGEPRALRSDEIPRLLEDYRVASRNALAAGFDGVEIHAANGYLIDQFLRSNPNTRTDAYGGPVANRVRLLREVTEAVTGVVGADRTGVRLSPNEPIQGVDDSDPETLFTEAAAELGRFGLAFLELREPGPHGSFGRAAHPPVAPAMQRAFGGPLVLNADYDGGTGQAALDEGRADAIAFGRTFLANPDLPARIRLKAPLNKDVQATWYSQGDEGYTDYTTMDAL